METVAHEHRETATPFLTVLERRDNADRNEFALAALAVCRSTKKQEGISSSRFFWYKADTIVIWTEGEASAFDYAPNPELGKAMFALADLGKVTQNWRMSDARLGEETYKQAGR